MAPRKHRRRKNKAWTLPAELLLEIIACSDPGTLVRCAATCKPIRRDILDPSFIHRVTQPGGIVPPQHVLAYLHTRPMRNKSRHQGPLVSLVHPATSAVSSFVNDDLAPYLLRRDISLLRRYNPVTSRGGLVVLRRRRDIKKIESSEFNSDICVYNPMTGDRTYLSDPPWLFPDWNFMKWVLLTATDGIGCSFMLLAADVDLYNKNITVQIARSSEEAGGTSWGSLITSGHNSLSPGWLQDDREAVVLHGGIINWLLSGVNKILTYDIHTERLSTVKLPLTHCEDTQRILGTLSDGGLRLVSAERFMITVWINLSDGWARESVIDTEQKLQSLHSYISPACMEIEFERSGERSGVVLLRAYRDVQHHCPGPLIVHDLETKEMRKQNSYPSLLFELDLLQLLQKMKSFL